MTITISLIEATRKMAALAVELHESTIYESCTHHVVPQPGRGGWFFLVDISSEKIVRAGTPEVIKAWLRIRNIADEKVYGISILPQPKIKEDE